MEGLDARDVGGFAGIGFEGPGWAVLAIVAVAVLLGAWKLRKIIWSAFSD